MKTRKIVPKIVSLMLILVLVFSAATYGFALGEITTIVSNSVVYEVISKLIGPYASVMFENGMISAMASSSIPEAAALLPAPASALLGASAEGTAIVATEAVAATGVTAATVLNIAIPALAVAAAAYGTYRLIKKQSDASRKIAQLAPAGAGAGAGSIIFDTSALVELLNETDTMINSSLIGRRIIAAFLAGVAGLPTIAGTVQLFKELDTNIDTDDVKDAPFPLFFRSPGIDAELDALEQYAVDNNKALFASIELGRNFKQLHELGATHTVLAAAMEKQLTTFDETRNSLNPLYNDNEQIHSYQDMINLMFGNNYSMVSRVYPVRIPRVFDGTSDDFVLYLDHSASGFTKVAEGKYAYLPTLTPDLTLASSSQDRFYNVSFGTDFYPIGDYIPGLVANPVTHRFSTTEYFPQNSLGRPDLTQAPSFSCEIGDGSWLSDAIQNYYNTVIRPIYVDGIAYNLLATAASNDYSQEGGSVNNWVFPRGGKPIPVPDGVASITQNSDYPSSHLPTAAVNTSGHKLTYTKPIPISDIFSNANTVPDLDPIKDLASDLEEKQGKTYIVPVRVGDIDPSGVLKPDAIIPTDIEPIPIEDLNPVTDLAPEPWPVPESPIIFTWPDSPQDPETPIIPDFPPIPDYDYDIDLDLDLPDAPGDITPPRSGDIAGPWDIFKVPKKFGDLFNKFLPRSVAQVFYAVLIALIFYGLARFLLSFLT